MTTTRPVIRLLGLAVLLTAAACGGYDSDGESYPPPAIDETEEGAAAASANTAGSGPCVEGERRHCEEVYGQHAGIVNCFEGEQTCAGGEWGDCIPTDEQAAPQ